MSIKKMLIVPCKHHMSARVGRNKQCTVCDPSCASKAESSPGDHGAQHGNLGILPDLQDGKLSYIGYISSSREELQECVATVTISSLSSFPFSLRCCRRSCKSARVRRCSDLQKNYNKDAPTPQGLIVNRKKINSYFCY